MHINTRRAARARLDHGLRRRSFRPRQHSDSYGHRGLVGTCVGVFAVALASCGGGTSFVTDDVAPSKLPTSVAETQNSSPFSESGEETGVASTDGAPSEVGTAPPAIDPSAGESVGGELVIDDRPDVQAPEAPSSNASFPLTVSSSLSHLVDQDGRPFFVSGDAAWSLLVQLDASETEDYLATRREQGFNTILVELIENRFSDDPPNNAAGIGPFQSPGDFSQPNIAYFDAAHDALEQAAAAGFLVLLTPSYLGYEGGDEGWYRQMVEAGPEDLREYGRFVGERFGDLDNVIWVQGGDFTPPADGLDLVEAVRDGIVDSGAPQLHTAHWAPETSGSDVPIDWLDLNTTYTYGSVRSASLEDDQVGIPHLLLESQYEADQFDNTSQRLREQTYEAVLTGAIGTVYGHGDVWQFRNTWRDALAAPGARDMTHATALFESVRWDELEPDNGRVVVADGSGAVTAAASADLSLIVAYLSEGGDGVSVELGRVDGTFSVRWFDPTSGTLVPASTTLGPEGVIRVEGQNENADGDRDWVVVVTNDTSDDGAASLVGPISQGARSTARAVRVPS